MKPYNLKIAAGVEEPYTFSKDSNFILLDESATVTVTIKSPDSNEQTVLSAGDWAKLTPFTDLRLSHDGTADTVFTIYVGRNTMKGSQRIGGSVEVTGGSKNALIPPIIKQYENAYNKKTFIGRASLTLALNGSVSSLWNPAGSGVTAIVRRAESENNAEASIGIKVISAPLGTVSASPIVSLSADNSNLPACSVYTSDTLIGGITEIHGNANNLKFLGGGTPFTIFDLDNGFLLPPGYGLICTLVGTGLIDNTVFLWDES